MENTKHKKYLILDCNGICHSIKHAMGDVPLNHEGVDTELIFGFLRSLKSLGLKYKPDITIFTWDSQISFRKKIDSRYKENRSKVLRQKTDREKQFDALMYQQFNIIRRQIIPQLGFKNCFIQTGVEADDIIASVVLNDENNKKTIVTSDEDLYQLLSKNTVIYNPRKKIEIKEKDFIKSYGVPVSQWVMVKAIAGCSSDNVIGINGVAEKTTLKYLKGNLPQHHKSYTNILNGDETIQNNLKLVKLPFNGTKIFKIEEDRLNVYAFNKLFKNYGFESFLKDYSFMEWMKAFPIR